MAILFRVRLQHTRILDGRQACQKHFGAPTALPLAGCVRVVTGSARYSEATRHDPGRVGNDLPAGPPSVRADGAAGSAFVSHLICTVALVERAPLEQLKVLTYAVTEKAATYRAIMRVFADAHDHYVVQLRPED